VRKYGTRYLYLGCEDFLCDWSRAKQLAHAIHDHFPKVLWTAQSRAQVSLPLDFLDELVQRGCRTIEFGVESADQTILDIVRKNIRLENARDCFAKAKQAGLFTHAYWLVGLPGETEQSACTTQETMLKWAEDGLVDTWEYKMFIPYPGTPIYLNPSRYGIQLLSSDFSQYHHNSIPVYGTEELCAERIYELYLEGSRRSAELLSAKHHLDGSFEVEANLSSFENMF
jgi:radical SAM superfamily enzyme YgiQ (UPF0313 family)